MENAQQLTESQLKATGMNPRNWTIHDKLAMCRGLVKLCEKDRKKKIQDVVDKKRFHEKSIKDLQKEVNDLRSEMQQVEIGETTAIRTALSADPALKLALQHQHQEKIDEEMDQKVSIKRLALDRLRDEIQKTTSQLVVIMLALSEAGSEEVIDPAKDDPQRKLHSRLQEANIKCLKGSNVQKVYKRIVRHLLKDQRFFGAVLESLKKEKHDQQTCLLRATELGQIATKEASDMRKEYEKRMREIFFNMQLQHDTLDDVKKQLEFLSEATPGLIRAESFNKLEVDSKSLGYPDEEENELERQVRDMEDLLERVKTAILVPDYNHIYPRMVKLLATKDLLTEELQNNKKQMEETDDRINMAKFTLSATINQSLQDEATFLTSKKELSKEEEELTMELEKASTKQNKLSKETIELWSALRRLWTIMFRAQVEEKKSWEGSMESAEEEENIGEKAMELIDKLKNKTLETLSSTEIRQEHIEKALELRMRRGTVSATLDDNISKKKVTLEVEVEEVDHKVPGRAEIKAISQRIYEVATRDIF